MYPWLLEIESIDLVTLCKYNNEFLFLMCAKKIFFRNILKQRNLFEGIYLTENIFYDDFLVFNS